MKIYKSCKNDVMVNVFFLFTYHQEECNEREKMLISCVSYSRQIPVLVFLIFATNFSTVSYRAVVSYKKTCSLNLVSFSYINSRKNHHFTLRIQGERTHYKSRICCGHWEMYWECWMGQTATAMEKPSLPNSISC